ncbi:cupin domain-containing protein [Paraglaciecola hydrolytica]|nr:hypothetical protein [Paraglaciecola hydrolytica]
MFVSVSGAKPKLGSKEILLDNDKVQIVRLSYPVGTESGMHKLDYANRAVYFVKGGKLELVYADPQKASMVLVVEDGAASLQLAVEHNVKNIGDTEIVIIETEIK